MAQKSDNQDQPTDRPPGNLTAPSGPRMRPKSPPGGENASDQIVMGYRTFGALLFHLSGRARL